MINSKQKHRILAVTVGLVILSSVAILQIPNKTELKSLIVQGTDIASVKVAVSSVGGEITHELGIINAVSVKLNNTSLQTLRQHQDILHIYDDSPVELSGKPSDSSQVSMCEPSSDQ